MTRDEHHEPEMINSILADVEQVLDQRLNLMAELGDLYEAEMQTAKSHIMHFALGYLNGMVLLTTFGRSFLMDPDCASDWGNVLREIVHETSPHRCAFEAIGERLMPDAAAFARCQQRAFELFDALRESHGTDGALLESVNHQLRAEGLYVPAVEPLSDLQGEMEGIIVHALGEAWGQTA